VSTRAEAGDVGRATWGGGRKGGGEWDSGGGEKGRLQYSDVVRECGVRGRRGEGRGENEREVMEGGGSRDGRDWREEGREGMEMGGERGGRVPRTGNEVGWGRYERTRGEDEESGGGKE